MHIWKRASRDLPGTDHFEGQVIASDGRWVQAARWGLLPCEGHFDIRLRDPLVLCRVYQQLQILLGHCLQLVRVISSSERELLQGCIVGRPRNRKGSLKLLPAEAGVLVLGQGPRWRLRLLCERHRGVQGFRHVSYRSVLAFSVLRLLRELVVDE